MRRKCRPAHVLATLVGSLAVVLPVLASPGPASAAPARAARHNVAPDPYFLQPCVLSGALSRECITKTARAINHARARESMRKQKLVLPRNYARLSRAEQTFVIINLERVDRGRRPIAGLMGPLNAVATVAALVDTDPAPATQLLRGLGVRRYEVLWAHDYGALASDYEWMYDDGYSGDATTNVGCRRAGAPGCWAHRRSVLARFEGLPVLMAGTGAANASGGADSVTAVLTGGYGRPPHFTYTWREALAHGAKGHRVSKGH